MHVTALTAYYGVSNLFFDVITVAVCIILCTISGRDKFSEIGRTLILPIGNY